MKRERRRDRAHWAGRLALAVASIGLAAFYSPGGPVGPASLLGPGPGEFPPRRLVSLAPSITETLFALGAGGRVKGVTDFCQYPPEARKLPRVGGYDDLNFEKIISLRPDLVVLLPDHGDQRARFQQFRIPTLTVEMNSLAGILSACIHLGVVCGCEAQGALLAGHLRRALQDARRRTRGLPRRRVLLVIGRDYTAPRISEVYVAGRGTFYDELLTYAGGENAYPKSAPAYPKLSAEGILALQPDLILELIPEPAEVGASLPEIQAGWKRLAAEFNRRPRPARVLTGDYLVIPGPRISRLLEDLLQALHPEASSR